MLDLDFENIARVAGGYCWTENKSKVFVIKHKELKD